MAIVDLETTGGSASFHRVIEVGVLVLENGKEVARYEQLVNPQMPVPDFISGITGITTADLEGAPTFEDIAHELRDLLEGSLFVAHNARFDYAFLKNEFERVGIYFSADRVCSVRLSRLLFRDQERHNLDAIVKRWGISVSRRHRALGDVLAVAEFFEKIKGHFGEDHFIKAIGLMREQSSLPPLLVKEALPNIPEQ